MVHLEDVHNYGARRRLSWAPEYRLWHTLVLVLVTGLTGWYGVYRAVVWLADLLQL